MCVCVSNCLLLLLDYVEPKPNWIRSPWDGWGTQKRSLKANHWSDSFGGSRDPSFFIHSRRGEEMGRRVNNGPSLTKAPVGRRRRGPSKEPRWEGIMYTLCPYPPTQHRRLSRFSIKIPFAFASVPAAGSYFKEAFNRLFTSLKDSLVVRFVPFFLLLIHFNCRESLKF